MQFVTSDRCMRCDNMPSVDGAADEIITINDVKKNK